jgi:hypothetical protein
MKPHPKAALVGIAVGSAIALSPYLLDSIFLPDPRAWVWIPPWYWLRAPGELLAGGGATPNMVLANTINSCLYAAVAYSVCWWGIVWRKTHET